MHGCAPSDMLPLFLGMLLLTAGWLTHGLCASQAGCIRAVAYQSEAFLAARMDAFQQQGLSQGNVPLASGDTHQVLYKLHTKHACRTWLRQLNFD